MALELIAPQQSLIPLIGKQCGWQQIELLRKALSINVSINSDTYRYITQHCTGTVREPKGNLLIKTHSPAHTDKEGLRYTEIIVVMITLSSQSRIWSILCSAG